MKIVIIGWKEGLNKVQLNKLLRQEFGYSINEAKKVVDVILQNNKVVLECEPRVAEKIREFDLEFEE